MTIENEHVRAERQQLDEAYDVAMAEGYESLMEPMPAFYFTKTLAMLTKKQRGYWIGREIRLWQVTNE